MGGSVPAAVKLVGKAGPLRGLSAGKGMDKGDQYG